MFHFRSLCLFTFLMAPVASGGIFPSWRANPIPPEVQPLLPTGAQSWSLMVELTGASQFASAGLNNPIAGGTYYNQVPFGGDIVPNPLLVPIFPDLEFDSYIRTTAPAAGNTPIIFGRFVGAGTAQVGVLTEFNVQWNAVPATGGTGPLEIARLTFTGTPLRIAGDGFPIGEVRASDAINAPVPVFGIPIPEPAAIVLLTLLPFHRRSAKGG